MEEFKAAKKALKLAIKASKRECFRKICDEAQVDLWGTAYKVVMKKMKGQEYVRPTCPILLRKIVESLFPKHPPKREILIDGGAEPFTPVSEEEVKSYARKIGTRKTPGADGITNAALKQAMEKKPGVFAETFNKCLQRGTFPKN